MRQLLFQCVSGLSLLVVVFAAKADDFDASTATVESVIDRLHGAMSDSDVETPLLVIDEEMRFASTMSFSPDSDQLVLATAQSRNKEKLTAASVVVLDVNGDNQMRRFEPLDGLTPGAVGITPDGRHVVVATRGTISVYDESNKVVHTHTGFQSTIDWLEVTADGEWIIAADKSCVVAKLPLLGTGSWRHQVDDWEKGFELFDASSDGKSVVVTNRKGKFLEILFPDGDGGKALTTDYGGRFDGVKAVARGNNSVMTVRGYQVTCGLYVTPKQVKFVSRQTRLPGIACARLSDDNKTMTFMSHSGVVVVFGMDSLSVGSVSRLDITELKFSRPDCWMADDASVYAIQSAGRLKVWKPTGKILNQTSTFHYTIQALFDERRFDILSAVCQRILKQDDTRISVAQLRNFLIPSQLPLGGRQRFSDLEAWYKADPDSIYPRLILSQIEKDLGFQARGSKVISQTSEQQIQAFEKHIAKSASYLDGYEPNESTPVEYYELRISQHLGGHQPDDFADTTDALMKFQPSLVTAHSQAMLFLMPRWFGEPGDCEKYADRLAGVLGGHEGEKYYVVLAEILLRYYPPEEYFELTQFKADRIQKYLDTEQELAKTDFEKDHVISQRVRFAYRSGDFDAALLGHKAAKDSGWYSRNRLDQNAMRDMLRVEQWLVRNRKMGGVIVNQDGTLDMKKLPSMPKSKK